MSDDELAEIEKTAGYRFEADRMLCAEYRTILSLIAEVRRQRDENRAMQSRLDIAEGRVEGMKNRKEADDE